MSRERWLPVVGYEGRYEVSDQGRARSLYATRGPRRVPRPMTLQTHRQYYWSLVLKGLGQPRKVYVHRLVLEAFVGPCPGDCVTDHVNGDGYDNRLANLRYVTEAENQRRRLEHGGRDCGPASPRWKHGRRARSTAVQREAYRKRKEQRCRVSCT